VSTPARQIERFLAKYDPAIRPEALAARRLLRKALPGATELVYDNYNALVFAFSSDGKSSGIILSIAVYPRWITLFFLHGTMLSDPKGLLEGSGAQIRGVRLKGGAKDLRKPAVRALIRQAVATAKVPLPKAGGQTVVRSISARQRPRRPASR